MALQVQTAKDAFERYKKDISDVDTDLFLDWSKTVYWSIFRKLTETNPDQYTATYTVPYVVGTDSYALPSGFGHIKNYKTGLFYLDSAGNPTSTLPFTGYGVQQEGFYLDNETLHFTPKGANLSTNGFELRYVPAPATFTALTDYFTLDGTDSTQDIIPAEYTDFVVKALDVLYNQWDEMPGDESVADFRFIRVMDELLGHIRKTPSVYNLSGLSNGF